MKTTKRRGKEPKLKQVRSAIGTILILTTAVLLPKSVEADFVFDYGNNHYEVVTTGVTWTAAAADATSRVFNGVGGQLARIDDAGENGAISSALLANIDSSDFGNTLATDGDGSYVWLGASDLAVEGDWIWDVNGDGTGDLFWQGETDGNPIGGLYNNWGSFTQIREPDDFFGQDGGGISLDGWVFGTVGQWNDVDDSNNLYYIVEFEGANVPEPVSAVVTVLFLGGIVSRRVRR